MKTTINDIKQFEIGKKYSMRSVCNYDCVWTYTVIGRTACTVTLKDKHGKNLTCRINKKLTTWNNAETVYPLGRYSMAPMLSAE